MIYSLMNFASNLLLLCIFMTSEPFKLKQFMKKLKTGSPFVNSTIDAVQKMLELA